jgi:translation initiation factor 1 (eIF-1/SUI1)
MFYEDDLLRNEFQIVRIRLIYVTGRRCLTIIEDLPSDINLIYLLKVLKSTFCCGGNLRDNIIELQGDHQRELADFLVKEKIVNSKRNIRAI